MKPSRVVLLALSLMSAVLGGACDSGGSSPTAPATQVADGSQRLDSGEEPPLGRKACQEDLEGEIGILSCDDQGSD